jgi:hypothetical protein
VIDENTCIVDVGSDAPHQLDLWLGMLDVDFEVLRSGVGRSTQEPLLPRSWER